MPLPPREAHASSLRRAAASAVLAGLVVVLAAGVVPAPIRTAGPVVLRPGAGPVDLTPALEVLPDGSGALDREAVLELPFLPAQRVRPGLARGALWVRFAIENGSDEPREWVVTVPGATLDRVDAWIDAGGATVVRAGGLAVAPASRTIALGPGWQEIPVPLGAGEHASVLARLASRGPLPAEAAAEERRPLAGRLAATVAGGAVLAAVLLALAAGAAGLFALRRARVHLDLALLAASLGALSLSSGIGPALLWPGAGWWAAAAPPALAAAAAHLSVRVAGALLGARRRGVAAAVASFAAASAAVALPFPALGNVAAGVAVLGAVGVVATWIVRAARAGDPRARPLAIGAAPLGVFALASVLAGAGLAPPPSEPALSLAFVLATLGAGASSFRFVPASAAPGVTLDVRADPRPDPAAEAARTSLERALEARTRELGETIDALRREGEARRAAEDGRREAEEALRRAEEARREAEEAVRRSEEVRRASEDALRRAEAEGREVAEARRMALLAGAPPEAPPPAVRVVEAPPGPPAVLLAEDDDVSIAAMRRALERAGYRVVAAGDGWRALAACEAAGGVDLVVADVGLPGMGGKELSDRILARWPMTRVLLTAASAQDVLGPAPGGFAFLPKPYSTGALAAKVRDLLAPRVERKAG